MTPYERVQQILDQAVGGPGVAVGVHGAFWRGVTRDDFIMLNVRGLDLLVVGNGPASNLVKALKGETPFGQDLPTPPPGAQIDRMPSGLPPVPDPDIAFIQKWIDDGCLEDASPPAAADERRWRQTNAPRASSRYDDAWFVTADEGWAVNSNGQILHTKDAFQTYEEQFHDAGVYLRCVAFASPATGWVGSITDGKILYATRNGGNTWSLVTNLPGDAPKAVCGLWVVNESVVYAAGSNVPSDPPRMIKTTDGGQTWTAWEMRQWADNLIDVYFTSPDRGWVVGGRTDNPRGPSPTKPKLRPVVLFTEDGGQTWVDRLEAIRDQFPLGEWGWKIQFLDDTVGFISLQNYDDGAIITTGDGGLTWARRPINDPQKNKNLEGIGFLDPSHGWVGGWGDRPKQKRTSSETLDGGKTWRDANEIGRTINRFRFLGNPPTVGFAAGETIYRYSAGPSPATPPGRPVSGTLLDSHDLLESPDGVEIRVTVPQGSRRLTVQIWDPDGPLVRVLADEQRPTAGQRAFHWDGRDSRGHVLARHAHVCRVTIDDRSESRLLRIR